MSPTERSLELLRKRGYRVAIVEKWNQFARRRQDLFGFIDILALRGAETLAVQTTTLSNVNARIDKIEDAEALADVRKAGWAIHVHGWRKLKTGWACKEIDVS